MHAVKIFISAHHSAIIFVISYLSCPNITVWFDPNCTFFSFNWLFSIDMISIESVVSAQVARSAFLKALRFPDAFNKEI